jgi:hypothetical protein
MGLLSAAESFCRLYATACRPSARRPSNLFRLSSRTGRACSSWAPSASRSTKVRQVLVGVPCFMPTHTHSNEHTTVDHGLCAGHVKQLLELHDQLQKRGVFHMDICPRHMMCHPNGGLLVIDWGFAIMNGDQFSTRLSGRCAVSLLAPLRRVLASAHNYPPSRSFPSTQASRCMLLPMEPSTPPASCTRL